VSAFFLWHATTTGVSRFAIGKRHAVRRVFACPDLCDVASCDQQCYRCTELFLCNLHNVSIRWIYACTEHLE